MRSLSPQIVAAFAMALAAAAGGCAQLGIGVTPVADIARNPASFEGKEVTVKGTVADVIRLPLVELKSYTLADSTGDLRVTTKAEAPAKGERLVVRGVVGSAVIVGGKALGVHLAERERSTY